MDVENKTTPTCIYPESKTCKTMKDNAQTYVDKIKNEYDSKKYNITYEENPNHNRKKYFEYNLQNEVQEIVCTIQLHIKVDDYKFHNTRGRDTSQHYGIYISSLYTVEKYRGQGHAIKLILYAICNTFLNNLNLNLVFVKLEDATSKFNQTRIKGPIYYKIGFTPTDIIAFNINRSNHMIGVDSGRVASMEHLLIAIVPKFTPSNTMNTQGGSSKRKTRKRKTKKNKRAL